MRRCRSVFACLLLAAMIHSAGLIADQAVGEEENEACLKNDRLTVRWDADEGIAVLADAEDGSPFARLSFDVKPEPPQQSQPTPWQHKTLGNGSMLEISLPDGGVGRIVLLPDVPFALVQKTLSAESDKERIVHHVKPFSITVERPAAPATELKALGTAGLTAPDGHPGSYAFLAIAEPKSREGIVTGWLSHDTGSGVVFSEVDQPSGSVRILPQIDYGRLRIPAGASRESEIFLVGHFNDARLGLEAHADLIAQFYTIRLQPVVSGYCTWYSNPNGGAGDEVHIAELAESAAEKLAPWGFDFVQIDDKWQAGERRNGPANVFTTHHPTGPYPSGMKKAAGAIASQGLMPGIWFMPFAGDHEDPFFLPNRDWFVKRADGTPYWARWGGTSLDMTHPGAREHLRDVVDRIAHQWDYRYFKMDGLWTGTATKLTYVCNGYVEDDIGEAVFHDPDKTNIEAYRSGMKLVRDTAGDDVFILGCCVSQNMRSFGGSFGLVDAMRIGPDNGTGWSSLRRGPWHGTNRYFLHGRVWYNDPDPVYVRPSVPMPHARLICSWVALSGQLTVFSEWLPNLPEDRVDLLRRSMPNHGLRPRPVDLFDTELARVWLVTDTRTDTRRDVIGLFNWNEHELAEIDEPVTRIGLPPAEQYVGFDYWADRFIPPFAERLQCMVPGGSCRVLAVRPALDRPQVISTSRHVTQGMVDIEEETWDADELVLHGRSRVVADDPYELRIVVPVGERSYRVTGAEVTSAETTVACKQIGPTIRVTVTSHETGVINWRVNFSRCPIEVPQPKPVTDLTAHAEYHQVRLTWNADDATRFRVARDDGEVIETFEPALTQTEFPRGTTCRYTVQAVGWDGRMSEPVTVEVTTPKELILPPVPPEPKISITTLKPLSATTGWGQIRTNTSCEGNPLVLGGKTYEKGIGTHAPAAIVHAIPEGATRFVATVGLDDEKQSDPRSSIVVKILGDVGEMGESPTLLATSPVLCNRTLRLWHFDLPLTTRLRKLHLIVTDAADDNSSDHVDWVNTGFLP